MRTRSSRVLMIQNSQKGKVCNSNNNPIINQVDDSDDDDQYDKPHFFKIIVSPLDEQKKHLRIPGEFVKKHGMHLSNDIWLNVPKSKQTWKVMLEKDSDDNLFLGKGWQAFMEFYNLNYGQLLVFRLDRGSQTRFRVLIFDKTAAEIDYTAERRTNSARLISVDNNITEDENVVNVGEDSPRSPKHNKTTTESVVNLDDDTSDSDEVKSSGYKRAGYVISNDMKKKLLRKLDEFKSSYPHFKVIMFPSFVQNKYQMYVSFSQAADHLANHFPSKSKQMIILIGPNGKKYHASFSIGERRGYIYSAGWKNFVLDNQVKTGDACMFELIDRHSHSYRVTVLRR